MAKIKSISWAEKDDPISTGRFTISTQRRTEHGINKSNMGDKRRTATTIGSRSDIHHSGKKSGQTEKD